METIIKIACPDQKGLVHRITGVLFAQGLNVIQTNEFVDPDRAHFFMRIALTGEGISNHLNQDLLNLLPPGAEVSVLPAHTKQVVVLATKEHHCLGDLLIKNQFKDLPFQIQAVIANHPDLQGLCDQFRVPFYALPSEGLSREEHEAQLTHLLDIFQPDLVVLAKYMRILSPGFTQRYLGKMINIHHSFLPAFVGANPYVQAHRRGVKIIGATAHFVTDDLDEGPIISQEVVPVNHSLSAKDMARMGKEVEKMALSKALKLVLEDRVFIHQNKTILFE